MVNASNHSEGVLANFDNAICVENPTTSKGIPIAPIANPKFLSVDLLLSETPDDVTSTSAPSSSSKTTPSSRQPVALYRHDLESFFYVLVFILARFRGGKDTRLSLERWESSQPHKLRAAKLDFINAGEGAYLEEEDSSGGALLHWERGSTTFDVEPVEQEEEQSRRAASTQEGLDGWERLDNIPLKRRWLVPLAALIKRGWDARRASEDTKGKSVPTKNEGFDYATLGGHLTYENFMKILDPSFS